MLASIFRFRLSNQRTKTLNPCARDGFHDLGNIGVHTNLSVGVTAGVHDRAGSRAMVPIAAAFLIGNPTEYSTRRPRTCLGR